MPGLYQGNIDPGREPQELFGELVDAEGDGVEGHPADIVHSHTSATYKLVGIVGVPGVYIQTNSQNLVRGKKSAP